MPAAQTSAPRVALDPAVGKKRISKGGRAPDKGSVDATGLSVRLAEGFPHPAQPGDVVCPLFTCQETEEMRIKFPIPISSGGFLVFSQLLPSPSPLSLAKPKSLKCKNRVLIHLPDKVPQP